MQRYLWVVILLILPSISLAQPLITSSDAVISEGQIISIFGVGFGQKATPAPMKWDKFDIGTDEAYLRDLQPEWVPYSEAGAQYSSTMWHSGGMALAHKTGSGGFGTNYLDLPHSEEIFISYWWRTAEVEHNAIDYGVIKLCRINSSTDAGGGGRYNEAGDTALSAMFPRTATPPYLSYNNGVESFNMGYVSTPFNEWCRIDTYKRLSTPGVADGAVYAEVIGQNDREGSMSAMTRAAGQSFQLDTVLLGLMAANVEGYFELYLDDIYVDNTLARVELGDNPVFESCHHREMQLPVTWLGTGSQVDISINQGSFPNGSQVWLFVVDSEGQASPGYQVTFTAGDAPSAPGRPIR